jgi:molecular chaperone DnaJ
VRAERELSFDLPPGVDTGSRLRLSGEGEPGEHGGPRGDLYVLVEVLPDEIFDRDGNNIVCEVPINITQAMLGDTIRVPTLDGEADVKVPPGTQPGTSFRLRGMGIKDLRGFHTGDEMVIVQVEIPTRLNGEQKELIKQFKEVSNEKHYPIYQRFLEKVKKSLGG